MTLIVREVRRGDPVDAASFARIRHEALPFVLFTPQSIAYDVEHAHPDAHYRPLLALEDGEPVGTAQVGIVYDSPEPGQGYVNVYVHPERTGRGAGSLLVRSAEERLAALGATRLFAWVLDAPANRAFAEKRGYRSARSAHFLRLDLANGELPPLQSPPPASRCAAGRTSRTTRGRCSSWTRRRSSTNPATSTGSSRTTRPGWRRPGIIRSSTTS